MEHDIIDKEDDSKMTVSIWSMTLSIWDILSHWHRPTAIMAAART
jgi:hypothetical protein